MKHCYLTTGMLLITLSIAGSAQAEERISGAETRGETVYLQSCAICHGGDGESMMPGVPDLAGNARILDQPDQVLERRIIDGYQSPGSALAMPARGGNPALTEHDVRRVITYMRQSFR